MKQFMQRQRILLISSLVMIMMLLAACGGTENETNAQNTPTPASTPTPTAEATPTEVGTPESIDSWEVLGALEYSNASYSLAYPANWEIAEDTDTLVTFVETGSDQASMTFNVVTTDSDSPETLLLEDNRVLIMTTPPEVEQMNVNGINWYVTIVTADVQSYTNTKTYVGYSTFQNVMYRIELFLTEEKDQHYEGLLGFFLESLGPSKN